MLASFVKIKEVFFLYFLFLFSLFDFLFFLVLSVTSHITKSPRGPGASPFFFYFDVDVGVGVGVDKVVLGVFSHQGGI